MFGRFIERFIKKLVPAKMRWRFEEGSSSGRGFTFKKKTYQREASYQAKQLKVQEKKFNEIYQKGKLLRHKRPEMELQTERLAPLPQYEKKEKVSLKEQFNRKKKSFLRMLLLTAAVVLLYFYWAPVTVTVLKIFLGEDCGYRRSLFEPLKKCDCFGKSFQINGFWEKTTFCMGECAQCNCWQLEVIEEGGKVLTEIPVRCPE
ncbi:hypothetical protein ACFL0Y_03935 [Patescibacteria group bacterium]